MPIKIIITLLASVLSLAQCAHYDYSKPNLQQGNLLSKRNVHTLKLGMTKEDVAIRLGTSLIGSTFNNDRWDYVYTWQHKGILVEKKHVVIDFKNDRVVKIQYVI